jgi:RHS repeat-associated protein
LGLSVDSAGVVRVQFANPHGDVVATATLGQTGLDNYIETDEYGQPANPAAAQPRYGWLGTHQRDTGNTIAGLTLMGARLYAPLIGRFLSIDPVPGGNDNRYTYPADPINATDLDGQCRWCRTRADGGGGGLSAFRDSLKQRLSNARDWVDLGPGGRIFGNKGMGAKQPGVLNNSPKGSGKPALGWSVHQQRAVFRFKSPSGWKMDFFTRSLRKLK